MQFPIFLLLRFNLLWAIGSCSQHQLPLQNQQGRTPLGRDLGGCTATRAHSELMKSRTTGSKDHSASVCSLHGQSPGIQTSLNQGHLTHPAGRPLNLSDNEQGCQVRLEGQAGEGFLLAKKKQALLEPHFLITIRCTYFLCWKEGRFPWRV